jgi:hypothetical protein
MPISLWKIGKANLEIVEVEIPYEGKPIGGEDIAVGRVTTYKATTTDLSTVIFGVVTWPDGNSEAIPVDVLSDGEQKYQRLQNAGRISIANSGQYWLLELNAMKFNHEQGKANLAGATIDELSFFVDGDLTSVFSAFGHADFGTKEVLIGETNRTRNKLALRCEHGNKDIVAAAYVVTRVLAILKDFGM